MGERGTLKVRDVGRAVAAATLVLLAVPAAFAGTVKGKVRSSVTGSGVSGVKVTVVQQTSRSATTASDGSYSISSVSAGTRTLKATKTGFVDAVSGSLTVPSSGTVTAPDIVITPKGTITGTVVNATGGAVVAGATVATTPATSTATTASNGTFSLSVAPGSYSLTITKSGWVAATTPALTVAAGATTAAGTISLTQNGTLSGKVVKASGSALSSATVKVLETGATATTPTAGTFSFSLPPGSYTLQIAKSGYATRTAGPYTVSAGATTATGNLQLLQPGTLSGKVVAPSGTAIAAATVLVVETGASVTTASSGTFSFSLPAGTYTLQVSRTGLGTRSAGPYTVAAGQTTSTGDLVLSAPGTLVGAVANAATGAPLAGVSVTTTPASSSATTAADGTFALSLGAGSYTVTAARAGWSSATTGAVTIVAGQTTDVGQIQLAELGTITGTVVNAGTGVGEAAATVTIWDTGAWAVTSADGTFALAEAPGSYTLVVTKAMFIDSWLGPVEVNAGQATGVGNLDLVPGGILSGKVVAAAGGAALADVEVYVLETGAGTVTTASGTFTLTLPAGSFHLRLVKLGYGTGTAGPYTVSVGQTAAAGNISLAQNGTVTGRVAELCGGSTVGLAGATVAVHGTGSPTTLTGEGGTFELAGVPLGAQSLDLSMAGYQGQTSGTITVVPDYQDLGTVLLTRSTGTLTGTVVQAGSGLPLSGVTVASKVCGSTFSTTTDASGAFALAVPWGDRSLTFTLAGCLPQASGPHPVGPGQTVATGTTTLAQGATVSGYAYYVQDLTGYLVELGWATVTADTVPTTVTTASDGTFSMTLPPGTTTLTVSKPDHIAATRAVTVAAGQSLNVGGLHVVKYGRVKHLIYDEANPYVGVAGVTVTVLSGPVSRSAETDSTGWFDWSLPPGQYTLSYAKTGWVGTTDWLWVDEDEYDNSGKTPLKQLGALAGTVVGVPGNVPIAGAWLDLIGGTVEGATAADGTFTVWDLPVAAVSVNIVAPGWAPATFGPFAITKGSTTNVGTLTLTHGGSLTGVVVNATDQTPIAGVSVTSESGPDTALTDAQGHFTLPDLTPGGVPLALSKAGWNTLGAGPFTVTEGQATDAGTLQMTQKGMLHGTVVDSETAAPVAGVTATVTGTSASTITGADGTFSLEHTAGHWTLTLAKPGWGSSTTAPFTIEANATAELGNLPLVELGRVHATLQTGGSTVTAWLTGTTVTAQTTGQLTLESAPGSYTLSATGPHAATLTTPPFTIARGQTTELGTLSMVSGGEILGSVSTVKYNPAPSYLRVTAQPGGHVSGALQGGAYSLWVPPGTYTLSTGGFGILDTVIGQVTVTSGAQATPPEGLVQMAGALVGTVISQTTDQPIPGATVTVDGTAIHVTTNAQGSFQLAQSDGTWSLTVSAAGCDPLELPAVSLTTGVTTNLGLITLTPQPGTITGSVVDGIGGAIQGASVTVSGTTVATATDASGAFTLAHVAGTHTLTVCASGLTCVASGPVTVPGHGTASAGAIQLSASFGTLSGTVLDAAQAPVAGALVSVTGQGISTSTDAGGAFNLRLAPGYLTLDVSKGLLEGHSAILRTVAGTTVSTTVHVVASRGVVTGTLITDPGGQPLPGATVTLSDTLASWSTTSDATGHYRLEVPAGTHHLSFSRAAWGSLTPADVTLEAGQTQDLGASAVPVHGALAGTLQSMGGPQPLGATVTWSLDGVARTLTDTTRFYQSAAVGTGTLSVTHPDTEPLATAPINVRPGHTVDLDPLQLEPYGVVYGTLSSTSGERIPGATVTVDGTGRVTATADTCTRMPTCEGQYAINAPPGSYTLTFAKEGYSSLTTEPITFFDRMRVLRAVSLDPAPGWAVSTVTFAPATVAPGDSATGTVTLTGPAPVRCFWIMGECSPTPDTVFLASSNAKVHVPASLDIPVGATSGTFQVTVDADAGSVDAVVTARYLVSPERDRTGVLQVRGYEVASLALDPASVLPGETSTATVSLTQPAHSGGALVSLTSSDAASATAPASVTVPQGEISTTFPVTTMADAPAGSATISASFGNVTKDAVLTFVPPALTGVAPGWTLPGYADVVVYGSGLLDGSTVELSGPVYALGSYQTPLCDLVTEACPVQLLPAQANADGSALTFAIPGGQATGLYRVRVLRGGVLTAASAWLAVDQASKSYPAVAPADHTLARAIHSGQTVTGSFAPGGDPEQRLEDFNAYYFMATAGSHIHVTLERVDTTKTWEHPDSLDPQLEIACPDGFIPQSLVSYDRQAGLDLDAELADAILPQTGMYVIYAGTTKGSGDYRLHLEVTQAATGSGATVLPLADSFLTIPALQPFTPTGMVLDPRGQRLSGASVTWAVTPEAGDTGTLVFANQGAALSNPDGTVQVQATPLTEGTVRYAPVLTEGFATELSPAQGSAVAERTGQAEGTTEGPGEATAQATSQSRTEATAQGTTEGTTEPGVTTTSTVAFSPIPHYQAVARAPFVVTAVYGDQSLGLSSTRVVRLPVTPRPGRREVAARDRARTATPLAIVSGTTRRTAVASSALGLADARSRTTTPSLAAASEAMNAETTDPALPFSDPLDASTAVPLPEDGSVDAGRAAGISSCDEQVFTLGIVPQGTVLHPPFTATLTDMTPATGGTQPQGEVGLDGIHGHRIEKTIHLKLEIKDATGQAPAYPVLVQLALAGDHHGMLIFNDGALECDQVAFLWKGFDDEGQPVDPEELDYRLGTASWYAGAIADEAHPGQVGPVWGVPEVLHLAAQAKLPDGQQSDPLLHACSVHPEPGKPDNLVRWVRRG